MTIRNEVIFSGHGLPMRIPVHITPTMRHPILWEIVDDLDEPVDQTGTEWEVTAHDAVTGETVYTYSRLTEVDGDPVADHELCWMASPEQTVLLDPGAAYEVRWIRTDPYGPDMLAAGPVIFTDATVPVEA